MNRSYLNKLRLAVNRLLAPSGFEIHRSVIGEIGDMEGALARLPKLGFLFGGVIDIGAAAGMWTNMSSSILKEPTFLMIEALREREADLQGLVAMHGPRLKYQICAAGPRRGEASFNVTTDLDGSGVIGSGNQTSGEVRHVEIRPLDELAVVHNLTPPYLLKFDTHGFELPILEGASEVLKQTDVIVMECYLIEGEDREVLFWQMCQILDRLGFRCFDIVDQLYRPRDGRLWQIDMLFARNDWPGFQSLGWP